ncbi:hypothetical protein [Microbacterium sp. 2FI]|uniref:hypothetical protein n=1 Tax=Microbacterium sp. 2FI TaxID=2502193 RepID=UPI0010F8F4BA|nr:hypothetical protein [Microbacterium sp. 2FI]
MQFTPERSDAIREALVAHVAAESRSRSLGRQGAQRAADPALRSSMKRRTTPRGQLVAASVALVLVGGVVGGTVTMLQAASPIADGSSTTDATAGSTPSAGTTYVGSGVVIEKGGEVALCLGGHYQSMPPTCLHTAIRLENWDWADAEYSTASHVRYTEGAVGVRGTVNWASDSVPVLVVNEVLEPRAHQPLPEDAATTSPSGMSNAELQQIVDSELASVIGPNVASVVGGVIFASVAFDDDTLQRAADAEFGVGVVVVQSVLQKE